MTDGLGQETEGLGGEPNETPDVQEDENTNEHGIPDEIYAELSDIEKEQLAHGWRPKDLWDGDPDDYVSARKFKQTGDLLSQIGKLKTEVKDTTAGMESRLKNATLFINAQNNMLRQQLQEAKTTAIKQGNVDEVTKIDKQLSDIPEEEDTADADDPTMLLEWKANNTWVFDESSEKFKFADNHFRIALAKKMPMPKALEYVDEKVREKYPDKPSDVNQRRNEPGLGEAGGRGTGKKSGKNVVPRSQWTDEEKQVAASLADNFNDDEITQMVADSRRVSQ